MHSEQHALHSACSSALGPNCGVYAVEWKKDDLDGKSMKPKDIFVDLMRLTREMDIPQSLT